MQPNPNGNLIIVEIKWKNFIEALSITERSFRLTDSGDLNSIKKNFTPKTAPFERYFEKDNSLPLLVNLRKGVIIQRQQWLFQKIRLQYNFNFSI